MAAAKAASKAKAAPKEKPVKEVPTEITWLDDKRAMYARLVVFNYAKSQAKRYGVTKEMDVNSVPQTILLQVAKDLVGSTYLHGQDGLEWISSMTKAGATDSKVAERGLTKAYCMEVRPFIRKMILAENFGRRGGLSDEEKAVRADRLRVAREKKQASAKKAPAKKSSARPARTKKQVPEKGSTAEPAASEEAPAEDEGEQEAA